MMLKSYVTRAALIALGIGCAGYASADFNTPAVDGTGINAANYELLSVQTEAPGFGAGNRMLALWAANDGTNLYVAIPGNFSDNAVTLYFDSKAGGVTELGTNTAGGFGEFDQLADDGRGLLPAGFAADLVVDLGAAVGGGNVFVGEWNLTTNTGTFLGSFTGGLSGGYAGAINNSNAETVSTALAATNGIEVAIPLSVLGASAGDVIEVFAVLQGKSPGDPNRRFASNHTFPPSIGAGNFGSDGTGAFGTGGNNYDGSTTGMNIRPLTYRIAAAKAPLVQLAFDEVLTGTTLNATAGGGFRGLDYDPVSDNWVVGSTAQEVILVNASDTSSTTTKITGTGTGDGTISQFEVKVSDDGYIFTNGFAGSVKLVGTAANPTINTLVVSSASSYTSSTINTGVSRTLEVVGKHAEGTGTIIVGRGVGAVVFQNSPANPLVYTFKADISGIVTGVGADQVLSIDSNPSATEIVFYDAGVNPSQKLYVGTPESGYLPSTIASYGNFESGLAIDRDAGEAYSGGGHSNDTRIAASRFGTGTAIGPGAKLPTGTITGAGFYSFVTPSSDGEGEVAYSAARDKVAVTNASGTNQTSNSLIIWDADRTTDLVAPVISPVSIASNNANPAIATGGDIITLTFVSNEDIATPTVVIAGITATVTGGPQNWSATVTLTGAEADGATTFTISGIADLSSNAAANVTATTDSSVVTISNGSSVNDWMTLNN